MRTTFKKMVPALWLCVISMRVIADSETSDAVPLIISSTIYENKLLCLLSDDTILVWSLPNGEPDTDFSNALSDRTLLRIAADNKTLWSIDEHRLFSWSKRKRAWAVAAQLAKMVPQQLVIANGLPIVIESRGIDVPTKKHVYPLPDLSDRQPLLGFRVLASHADGDSLWIGTGQGEWGGNLFKLNVRSGKWTTYFDEVHYVTGITRSGDGTLYASWSMSHLSTDTLIRTHRSDAEPLQSFPQLSEKYFQFIVYSNFDDTLYGIEQNDLVSIKDGAPMKLAELGDLPYETEKLALGAAPSVAAMYPIAPHTLIIVHRRHLPYIYENGALRELKR